MRTKTVMVVFRKEMRETLRDRRTLMTMVAVPILIVPIFMIFTSKLLISQVGRVSHKTSDVVLISEGHLPDELGRLLAATDGVTIRAVGSEGDRIEATIAMLKSGEVDLLIVVPTGFDKALLAETTADIRIYVDQSEFASKVSYDKIRAILDAYQAQLVSQRLAKRGIIPEITHPVRVDLLDVASAEKRIGEKIGGLLPYMILIMCFTGAMYPAIDLAAGEKERGTLETLLISPASRRDFVLGKFLVVFITGVVASLLSMVSMIVSTRYMVGMFSNSAARAAPAFAIRLDLASILSLLAVIIPTAGFFGAVLLSISVFARSFKEAQNYITTGMMFVIFPAFVAFAPGIKLNLGLSLIPIVNASLIIKEAMFGELTWYYVLVAALSLFALAVAALAFARSWFERESVIFRL